MHSQIKSNKTGNCSICGMPLEPFVVREKGSYFQKIEKLKWRLWLSSLLTIPVIFLHLFPTGVEEYFSLKWISFFELILASIVVWVAGWPLMIKWWHSLQQRDFNKYTLIGFGILIAYLYSFVRSFLPVISLENIQQNFLYDLYFEPSAVITTLVLAGQFIELKAVQKTYSEIHSLTDLTPRLAHLVLPNGEERKIALEDVKKSDYLRVKPGERVPVDGRVKEGQSWINESMITGEVIPIYKRPKDKVFGGTLNGNSAFILTAEKIGGETLISQITQLIKDARLSKSPMQKITENIVKIFIPLVLAIAFFTGLIWLLLGYSIDVAVSHVIAVLIIASPSALALAIPMSMGVGIGVGVGQGILIKDCEALENLEKITTLVIDKAGTLTEGKPLLTKIFARFPYSEPEVLKLAASVETHCNHPIAQAIVSGAKLKQLSLLQTTNFQCIEGKGVIAYVDGSRIGVGNAKLLKELGIETDALDSEALKWQKDGQTVVFVALEFRAIGLLSVSDSLKFNAERAVHQLHAENLRLVMATGDTKEAAVAVGKRLHIDEVEADVLPQNKMALVQKLQRQGQNVAMAGDAESDAPALSQANVGIAMGLCTEHSINPFGISLLKSDLNGVVRAFNLSKAIMHNAKQNLLMAGIYNLIAIPLAAGVLNHLIGKDLTPVVACIAMTLSIVAVIGNALRLRYLKLFD